MTKLSDYNVLSIDIDWCQSHFHLNKLNRLFYDKIDKAKKIVFAKHHHQIIPHIIKENNIVLHNIDHHHDIQYEDWQVDFIGNHKATHGSWVGNLIALKKIKEYYWYNNLDSDTKFSSFVENILFNQQGVGLHFTMESDLDKIQEIDSYDLMFVCSSPEYCDWAPVYQSYLDCCKTLHGSKTTISKLIPDMRNTPINCYV